MRNGRAWRLVAMAAAGLLAFAAASCESDSNSTDPPATTNDSGSAGGGSDTAGGGGETSGATTNFPAGVFQLTTYGIQDNCLDGGLEILFMPQGSQTPYDLANTTEFFAYADLPKSYNISLQAPFTDMPVTVEQDGLNKMKVENSLQTDVELDNATYGDCNADMAIDADIVIVDADNLTLSVELEVSDWQSSGQTCPTPKTDPCKVTLDMRGVRKP